MSIGKSPSSSSAVANRSYICVPTTLSRPDQPAWYHTVPLQSILPQCFTNVTVKVIAEFMEVPSLLCRMVRLQLHGVLLDGFVISEEEDSVVVLAGCGASLRIPRADLGGLVWKVDPDTNPHALRQMGPAWFAAAVDNGGRMPVVDTIELHTNSRVLAPLGSVHRRVRCFEPNETKRNIFKPPLFLYVKMYFPYLSLKGIDKPAAPYLREQAAHALLPHCKPLVAPLAHYVSFHEETGSYCIITDDVTGTTDYFHPMPSDVAAVERGGRYVSPEEAEEAAVATRLDVEKRLLRLAGTLAALHGRWLSAEGTLSQEQALRSRRVTDLSKVMVHPLVFYAEWLQVIETQSERKLPPRQRRRVKAILARLYGQPVPPPVEAEGGTEKEKAAEGGTSSSSLSVPSSSSGGGGGGGSAGLVVGSLEEDPDADIAVTANSLTLIHGHICPAHVLMADDPRAVPTAYLVDWKRSGVGPLEVDLLQAYAQYVSKKTRRSDPELLLRIVQEYSLSLDIYYGCRRARGGAGADGMIPFIASLRDVCQLMLLGGPCDWNLHGELEMALSSIYQQLSDLTRPEQVLLMAERLRNGGY